MSYSTAFRTLGTPKRFKFDRNFHSKSETRKRIETDLLGCRHAYRSKFPSMVTKSPKYLSMVTKSPKYINDTSQSAVNYFPARTKHFD